MTVTTIGSNILVEGRLEGADDVVVHGRVVGSVALEESFTVAEDGYVEGDIEARIVRIEGRVKGSIRATELLHLTPTAQVQAELHTPSLRIDDGAALSGDVEMADGAPSKAVTQVSAVATRTAARPVANPVAKPKSKPAPARRPAPSRSVAKPAPRPRAVPERSTPRAAAQTARATTTTTVVVEEPPSNNLAEYDELTVKELRDRLRALDLAVSGTKSELVQRLAAAE